MRKQSTRTRQRPRRYWPKLLVRTVGLVGFRWDIGRRAYVLRGIGHRWGPVVRER